MSFLDRSKQRLYVIAANPEGPVKIGIATNPQSRLKELQTGSPYKLKLWAVGDAYTEALFSWDYQEQIPAWQVEQCLHEYWDEERLSGEWFDIPVYDAVNCFPLECGEHGDMVLRWEILEDKRLINSVVH